MDEPRIKGAAIREFLVWYGEQHGEARVRALASRAATLAGPGASDASILNLLPSTWYPARLVHAVLDAVSEGESDAALLTLAHDATRAVVARGTGTVYRFLLRKMATPELYALSVPRFWTQLHSTGERRMEITGAAAAVSAVSRWPGHHPLLCTITIETMVAIFETMGLTDVRWRRVSCISRGGVECRTELSWKKR